MNDAIAGAASKTIALNHSLLGNRLSGSKLVMLSLANKADADGVANPLADGLPTEENEAEAAVAPVPVDFDPGATPEINPGEEAASEPLAGVQGCEEHRHGDRAEAEISQTEAVNGETAEDALAAGPIPDADQTPAEAEVLDESREVAEPAEATEGKESLVAAQDQSIAADTDLKPAAKDDAAPGVKKKIVRRPGPTNWKVRQGSLRLRMSMPTIFRL